MKEGKRKILIVDDSDLNRALLSDILADDYDIIEAADGFEALAVLNERGIEISLVLLDIVMPKMDGFEVLTMMNKNGWIKTIPVIMISSENGGAYIDRAYDLGAIDYINRPFDDRTVRHRVACNAMMAMRQSELQEMLYNQIYEKEKDNDLMIEILSNIVEFRNGESGLHVLHVHTATEMLLNQLVKKTDKYKLSVKDIRLIAMASALHDIGKISIPSEILNKPGKFTPEEYEIMKRHTIEGANMLDNLSFRKDEALVKVSYQICRWHHERYDGRGYPDGIKGDDIPISAQVVALADVYDALTSRRCYKPPIEPEKAVAMITGGECGAFNPLLLECLNDIADELKSALKIISNGETVRNDLEETVQQLFKTDGTDMSRRMVKQIEHERMKYKYLADISKEITFEYVLSPEMVRLSDWSSELLGMPSDIMKPADDPSWCSVFPRDAFVEFTSAVKNSKPQDPPIERKFKLVRRAGEPRWYKLVAKPMWVSDEEDILEGAICKMVDIHDTVLEEKRLKHRADHDLPTGLLNRNAARRKIERELNDGRGRDFALLFFDVDDFKKANDSRGHAFGDKVVETVANRVKGAIRSTDIAARMGGDEFMIFMESHGNIESIVDRIYHTVCGDLDGFNICLSMGIALAKGGETDYETFVNMADTAMYHVKRNGKHKYSFYDESMSSLLKDGANS